MLLLFVFGIGLLAGAVATVVTWRALRRLEPGARSVRWVAPLAGAAVTTTWVLFGLEWVFHELVENQPSYYPHSDYEQYRRAVEPPSGIAIGLGYVLLAGSLVAVAEVARRRAGVQWGIPVALAAIGAVTLPLVVPAILPRAEYGKDAVFHVSRSGPYEYPPPGNPELCFFYGVQRIGPDPPGRASDPELCLEFRPTAVSRRLVQEPSPVSEDAPTIYDVANELNESDVRPQDPVEADVIDIQGLELVGAQWTGALEPPTRPLATPPQAVEELGEARERAIERRLRRRDREMKRRIVRVATYLRRCKARTADYMVCADRGELRRLGGPLGTGSGQLHVVVRSRENFAIEGFHSHGGSFDTGERPGRPRIRTCHPAGAGGCPADGTW